MSQLVTRTKKIVSTIFAVLFVAVSLFLVCSGRPTADEYLLAPVSQGFYVDRPDVPLFIPAENSLVRYFQGAHAIVKLGWDAWPNALTFQMGSGVLTNLTGPGASIAQGLAFFCWAMTSLWITCTLVGVGRRRIDKSLITMAMSFALMCSMSVGDFHTDRTPFGLYPFIGIRFGLYFVHALALVALVLFLLSTESSERGWLPTRRETTAVVAFVGFVSLWYALYLIVFLTARMVICTRRPQKALRYLALILCVTASVFVFHAGLTGAASRTSVGSSSPQKVVLMFVRDVVLNTSSRLYDTELWVTVLGPHTLVATAMGIAAAAMGLGISDANRVDLRKKVSVLMIATFLLPLVFCFQEFVTYVAWWHRTTPLALSSMTFLLVGILVGQQARESWFWRRTSLRKLTIVGSIALALGLSLGPFLESLLSINRFRASWDAGNVLAIGTPLYNDADYNVRNVLRLERYTNKNWRMQERVLSAVQVLVEEHQPESQGGRPLDEPRCVQRVTFGSSPFSAEVGSRLIYEIDFEQPTESPIELTFSDSTGTLTRSFNGQAVLRQRGFIAYEGQLIISSQESPCTKSVPNILEIRIGVAGEIRERFDLAQDNLVVKFRKGM